MNCRTLGKCTRNYGVFEISIGSGPRTNHQITSMCWTCTKFHQNRTDQPTLRQLSPNKRTVKYKVFSENLFFDPVTISSFPLSSFLDFRVHSVFCGQFRSYFKNMERLCNALMTTKIVIWIFIAQINNMFRYNLFFLL